jgi:hypothetical protein
MNESSRFYFAILLATGCAFPVTATAADLDLAVHRDHVIANGRVFNSMDALERFVTSKKPHAVKVQACGTDATRAWTTVIYRLRNFPLEPAVLDAHARECATHPVVTPASMTSGHPFIDPADELAAQAYWRELMP